MNEAASTRATIMVSRNGPYLAGNLPLAKQIIGIAATGDSAA